MPARGRSAVSPMRPSLEAVLAATAFLLAAAATVYTVSEARLQAAAPVRPGHFVVPDDGAAVAEGRRLAHEVARCAACHGPDLGGLAAPGGAAGALVARVPAPNLTAGRGGLGAVLRDEEWALAIRHGLARDGRPLWGLPHHGDAALSDAQLGALVAYLRRLPPVDRETPPRRIGPVGRLLLVAGRVP